MLHGWLSGVQDAADRFVALTLHHQRQHFHLALSQAEIGWQDTAAGRRNDAWLGASKRFGRNIDVAGKYQTQRIGHELARSRLRNEAERTKVEGPQNGLAIMKCRQDHDRNSGVMLAQVG